MQQRIGFLGIVLGMALFLAMNAVYVATLEQPALKPKSDKMTAGEKDDPYGRLNFELMMLRDPETGRIPENIRSKELEFARSLPRVEEVYGTTSTMVASWVSRGPWNVGGRTRALGIDVNNASLIIAGGVSGGMWRSVNSGTTWTKISVPSSLHSVSCLAQDTRSGQTATWYYGTGEFLGNSAAAPGGPYSGDGIFKSTNSGASWTLLPSTSTGNPHTFDNFFDYVWNIVVDPANGNVYAATYGTIFRSTNGGTSWAAVLGGTSPFSSMTDIQVTSTGILYATGSADGGMGGVWRSTTGAAGSWTNITPTDMPSSTRRIVIGIAPSNINTVYFLAETPSAGLNGHSLWRYNALSNTYVNRSANLPAFGAPVGDFDSQGSYDLVIKVKPDNENVVIIGGTNLYRSTDGFATTSNTTWIGGYSTANDISLYPNHHPDQHALAFVPGSPSQLYSGHDEGVGRTTNVMATPVTWQSLSNGYLTTQFYTVAIDHGTPGSNTIVGGLQDNGSWKTTSTSVTTPWSSMLGGDGAFTAIANGGTSEYVSSQNGRTYRFAGANWTRVDPAGGTNYLFINPFVLDPNNSVMMYMAAGTYVWRNSNLTQIPLFSNNPATVNWTRLNNSAAAGSAQVSALAVSTTNPANRLYIGDSEGYVRRVDGANTGDPTAVHIGGSLPSGYISSIAVDPTDGNKVLVVFSNYNLVSLFYSTNAGASWTNVEGNLAGASGPSCRYATIVPIGGTTYYLLGTSVGLYRTTQLNGASTVWAQEGANSIGNVVVPFVVSRPADRMVVAGTHGYGVFSADLLSSVGNEKPLPTDFTLHQNYPNPFNPSTTIRFTLPQAAPRATLEVFNVAGELVWARGLSHLASGDHEVTWEGHTLNGNPAASGMYMYRLSVGEYSATKRMVLLR